MTEETTIVFELTQKEAAILCEMLSVYSWDRGQYGELIRSMYFELDKEVSDRAICESPWTVSSVGVLPPGDIWLEDQKTAEYK